MRQITPFIELPVADRLRRLADVIERNERNFCMAVYEVEERCGTMRCIAGWALHLAGEPILGEGFPEADTVNTENAAELLGLSFDQAYGLFHNMESTAKQAATKLRQIANEQEST